MTLLTSPPRAVVFYHFSRAKTLHFRSAVQQTRYGGGGARSYFRVHRPSLSSLNTYQ